MGRQQQGIGRFLVVVVCIWVGRCCPASVSVGRDDTFSGGNLLEGGRRLAVVGNPTK